MGQIYDGRMLLWGALVYNSMFEVGIKRTFFFSAEENLGKCNYLDKNSKKEG